MYHHSRYAETMPDKPAYIMAEKGHVVTWKEHSRRVNRLAQYFKSIGLKAGDHIAILMENNPVYFEIVHAAIDAGLIYTCISTKLNESEIEYILDNSDSCLLITTNYFKDLAWKLLNKTPKIGHRVMFGGVAPGYESYEKIMEMSSPEKPTYGNAGRMMLYSSGTTGRPKGVLSLFKEHPVGAFSEPLKINSTMFQLNDETVYLSPAPLYHAAPLAFCTAVLDMGGTVVVMEKFDAERSLEFIDKYKVTHSQWVPTMFIRMLKLPEKTRSQYDMTSMKVAIHAAAPIPIPVKEQMIDWWGPIIVEYYSCTEGITMTMISCEEWMTHKGTVGKTFLGTLHILDDEGNELPPNKPGLIYVEDGMPFEYYKEPEKTRDAKNEKNWATAGDIGYLDEEGYLYLTDRKSFMIISGGVNIYPQEIENFLIVHPKVKDVAVIGVPNEDFGEEVKAVVQLMNPDDSCPELEQQLIDYCRDGLSHVKCPKTVDFVSDLPRTPTGKMLKRLLIDQYSN